MWDMLVEIRIFCFIEWISCIKCMSDIAQVIHCRKRISRWQEYIQEVQLFLCGCSLFEWSQNVVEKLGEGLQVWAFILELREGGLHYSTH